ncbi:MAG: thermonuclease family protein [Chloroflexi bacterium]|nr:thermonuclease family protein [Chloroflexota bacterium]MCI0645201.1 thermonuclease family protein [Chloroflexota bacterium]MCI0731514.1 thermonuclease family protein [Chloroflexota bacterium]
MQTVTLVKDVSETGRYGRLVRYVYLQDGAFVNAELIGQGYALAYTYPPTSTGQRHPNAFQRVFHPGLRIMKVKNLFR